MKLPNRLDDLIEKAINGTIADEERRELLAFLATPEGKSIYDDLFEQLAEQSVEGNNIFSAQEATSLFQQINEEIRDQSPVVSPKIFKLKPILAGVAACMLLLISLFSYRFFVRTKWETAQQKMAKAMPAPRPATGIMLTLADGRQIALDSAKKGETFEQKGSSAVNNEKGTLSYTLPVEDTTGKAETVFNTLTIPRGKQYKVILPDGSQVWLNAASSLHYPTQFPDGERKVELSGEAYFDIVKNDRKPFKVVTEKQTITVLGTAFNVKAYTDESYTKTTLIEGRVKLESPGTNNGGIILKPGEQGMLDDGRLQIKAVDTRENIAWRSDLFYFSNTDLKEVAYQLQRWYDIDVDFSSLPAAKLYGQLPRSTPLPQLLKVIEKTTNIKLRVNNSRLYVEQ
ncbi:FecR family protein [Chitinophaga polysaccharea]|uniref:FecR family protein n=1 Tax=Chitinophaga polysaccharea TaxID=1293035 RepID=A0A561P769_9BACT|nr:FecR family protein [Chitinophaga polysaccharea]TWF33944.1 FecR family protein [Chitinophaga polysaccharea]